MTSKLFEETTAPYMYTGQDYLEPKTTATEPIPVKDFPISLVFNGEPLYTKSRAEQLLKSLSGEVEELKAQLEYEKTKNGAYRKLAMVGDHLAVDRITLAPPTKWMPLVHYREPERNDIAQIIGDAMIDCLDEYTGLR
jgi:hypothetical protein